MAEPLSGAGGFRLDIGAAEVAVRKLQDVQRQLEEARDEALKVSRIPPSARDAVSLEASALLSQKADGGPGSFTAAMDAGRAYVDQLIAQMRADIAQQRELDDAARGLVGRA